MLAGVIAGTMLLGGVAASDTQRVCIGDAWLPLRRGEHARHWIGPDQSGYVITEGDGKRWELGIGGYGTPLGRNGEGLGRPVLTLPGHVVHERRRIIGSSSAGYLLLATRILRDGNSETMVDSESVYITGSALTGGPADRSFFRRFVFGGRAKAACGKAVGR